MNHYQNEQRRLLNGVAVFVRCNLMFTRKKGRTPSEFEFTDRPALFRRYVLLMENCFFLSLTKIISKKMGRVKEA